MVIKVDESLENFSALQPFFTLIGVIVGVVLTYILTKKQRRKDELFGYKVKAYLKLSEVISHVIQDYNNGLSIKTGQDTAPFNPEDYQGPLKISMLFQKVYSENYLFFSDETKSRADKLRTNLYFSGKFQVQKILNPDIFTDDVEFRDISSIISECEMLQRHIYNDIGLDTLD